MNKKKVILSIALLLSLIGICMIIPLTRSKRVREVTQPASETNSDQESEAATELELIKLDFQDFEELEAFFSEEQLENLKKQLIYYLSLSAPNIDTITFIPEGISYPNPYTLKMLFQLSDGSELPVCYDLKSDTYAFTDEETILESKEDVKYEKETDDTLPSYTTEEVEAMQEGGFPDTETSSEAKEVQP